MADYNPMTDPNRAGQGYGTSGKDIWSPTQNRWIDTNEVKQFLSSNPNQQQILSQASNLGLTSQDLNTALKGQGYSGQELGQKYGTLTNNLWTGGLGYSAQNSGNGAQDGRIVKGGGNTWIDSGRGDGSQLSINGTPSNITYGEDGAMNGGGGSNLGMGSSNYGGSSSGGSSTSSGGTNPYLQGMGNTIVSQMTDNYTRNQLPSMRSGAMAAGGFGGSRQGVVEANGLRDLNLGIGQNLTNLYGQDWTNSQNRNLQQQSINNSYDLGLKSNDLGLKSLDSNNQQFGANYGLNVQNQQIANQQAGVNASTQMQNTPTQYQTMFGNQQNQIAGQGGTNTSTQTNQGNPWLGALGGYQLANAVYK